MRSQVGGRVRRIRRNHGFEWEPGWVRRGDGGQADQGEVLDGCCHMTFASAAFRSGPKGYVIT